MPPTPDYEPDRHVALDFAAGGDENVIVIRRGNIIEIIKSWRERDTMLMARQMIEELDKLKALYSIRPNEVSGDADGLGLPVIQRMAELGWKINEFHGNSTAKDLTCKNRITDCWETKDGELRHVPLTDRFKEFLQTFGKPSPYMVAPWKPKKGKSRYRYDIRAPFEKYVTDKGMSWVTPHVMRHTFISLRVQAGVSLSKIAIWTGTAVKVLQEHYAHLAPIYDRDIEV